MKDQSKVIGGKFKSNETNGNIDGRERIRGKNPDMRPKVICIDKEYKSE